MNLGTIQAKARRKLDELSAKFWDPADLIDYINEGYDQYWQKLILQTNPGAIKEAILNIFVNNPNVPLPSDYIKASLVERVLSTGVTVPLSYKERTQTSNYKTGSAGDAYIPNYRFVAQNLVIEPGPIGSITGGIKLTYFFEPPDMVLDSDSPDPGFKVLFHNMLVMYCVVAAKEKEESLGFGGADISPVKQKLMEMEAEFMNMTQPQTRQRQFTECFSTDGDVMWGF